VPTPQTSPQYRQLSFVPRLVPGQQNVLFGMQNRPSRQVHSQPSTVPQRSPIAQSASQSTHGVSLQIPLQQLRLQHSNSFAQTCPASPQQKPVALQLCPSGQLPLQSRMTPHPASNAEGQEYCGASAQVSGVQQLPSAPHSPSQQPSAQQCWASRQQSAPQANESSAQQLRSVVQLVLKQQPLPPQHL
jgi:hypothetical protein